MARPAARSNIMTVFTCTFVDQVFDKKSAEVAYIEKVIGLVAQKLSGQRGTVSTSQNVLGVNAAGTPNTTLATFTYTASASNP
jgi:hypothetical protein